MSEEHAPYGLPEQEEPLETYVDTLTLRSALDRIIQQINKAIQNAGPDEKVTVSTVWLKFLIAELETVQGEL